MKNVVLFVAGSVLILSFLFPNGIAPPAPTPAPPAPVTPVTPTDAEIVQILTPAARADRARIVGVYESLAKVLQRDGGRRVNTTEKWAEVQANTLQLAIDTPGKYPGLDVAIERVFKQTVGTDDVLPVNKETQEKLITACKIIAASAK